MQSYSSSDPLSLELVSLIRSNDVSGLHAKFSKRGRPKKDTQAITEEDKVYCLQVAMPEASLDVIDALIGYGAYLNQQSFRDALARGDGETELLDLMLERGWTLGGLWYGTSIVESAIRYQNTLRWLLTHGANPNITSNPRLVGSCADRTTPLARAAGSGRVNAMEILLDHGATLDPNAIHRAIKGQKTDMAALRFLIARGLDVNRCGLKRSTLLNQAVYHRNVEAVKVLLEAGADPNIVTSGSTAAEYARKKGRVAIAEILEAAMPRRSRRLRGVRPSAQC